jgi:hypothetical protein
MIQKRDSKIEKAIKGEGGREKEKERGRERERKDNNSLCTILIFENV